MAESSEGGPAAPRRSPALRSDSSGGGFVATQGILRLDLTKPRRSSGGSVDFRVPERDGIQVHIYRVNYGQVLFRK